MEKPWTFVDKYYRIHRGDVVMAVLQDEKGYEEVDIIKYHKNGKWYCVDKMRKELLLDIHCIGYVKKDKEYFDRRQEEAESNIEGWRQELIRNERERRRFLGDSQNSL